jgi:hypothetical protein
VVAPAHGDSVSVQAVRRVKAEQAFKENDLWHAFGPSGRQLLIAVPSNNLMVGNCSRAASEGAVAIVMTKAMNLRWGCRHSQQERAAQRASCSQDDGVLSLRLKQEHSHISRSSSKPQPRMLGGQISLKIKLGRGPIPARMLGAIERAIGAFDQISYGFTGLKLGDSDRDCNGSKIFAG